MPTRRKSKVNPAMKAFMAGKKTGGKRTSVYTKPVKIKTKAKIKRKVKNRYKLSSASSRAAKKL